LAAGLAIYFWPVKMILELVKNKNEGLKKIIVAIVSNFLYSAVLCISAVWLYYPDGSFLQTAFSIIGLANVVTGLVYYLFAIDDKKAIVHFMLNLLPCTALF
jgi:multisubunit Na+/H+ antiporter MnhB subunit